MVFALFGATAPVGAIVGAAIGSAIAVFWWPWAFWAMGIWLAIVSLLGFAVLPDMIQLSDPGEAFLNSRVARWRTVAENLDLPGAVTGVASLVLFNFAWNQAPVVGWASAEVIVPLVLSLVLFGLFTYIEKKVSRPLLPLHAINSSVSFVLVAVGCG